jgi:hypothetical protein
MDDLGTIRSGSEGRNPAPVTGGDHKFTKIIDDICSLAWNAIDHHELFYVSQSYYYFSIQFRENLEIALALYPQDEKLRFLHTEECNTDNLSPWPRIAMVNEKLNHDEFMKRALLLQGKARSTRLDAVGSCYLHNVRSIDLLSRAKSIASYEDNGLSRVFSSMLRATDWRGPALQAFKFFLERHIEFDSDSDSGHGALSRHLLADDSIVPLWSAFHDLLLTAAPGLSRSGSNTASATSRSGELVSMVR